MVSDASPLVSEGQSDDAPVPAPPSGWMRQIGLRLDAFAAWALGETPPEPPPAPYFMQDEPWWPVFCLLTWVRAIDDHVYRQHVTEKLEYAENLIEEVIAIESTGEPDNAKTAFLRLTGQEFFFVHWSEYRCDRFFSDSLVRCAAAALLRATEPKLRDECLAIVAGPFDRTLPGWLEVAADWWEENGEDDAAGDLRKLAEYEREYGPIHEGELKERLMRLYPPEPWSDHLWDPVDSMFR